MSSDNILNSPDVHALSRPTGQISALRSLQDEIDAATAAVRTAPQAIKPRMALFQLACVIADWQRARTQLATIVKLDAEYAVLAQVYGHLIKAEVTRTRVFGGDEQPVALGQPTAWLAILAQALGCDRVGNASGASALRAWAREDATPRAGLLEGQSFAWIMDADPRLGPVLEIIADSQYRWLPFDGLRSLHAQPPQSIRDLIWQPVTAQLVNGTEFAAFVPTRYPGSEAHGDTIRLARETHWIDANGGQIGIGQRMLATDLSDHAFLDLRELSFDGQAVING